MTEVDKPVPLTRRFLILTRGHTGLKRPVLGSVAAAVSAKAPCPVLLVPLAAQGGGRRKSA